MTLNVSSSLLPSVSKQNELEFVATIVNRLIALIR